MDLDCYFIVGKGSPKQCLFALEKLVDMIIGQLISLGSNGFDVGCEVGISRRRLLTHPAALSPLKVQAARPGSPQYPEPCSLEV
jgi:hypothetical protein